MHDLPTFLRFVQDDSSPIEKPCPIVEMKGRNRHVSEELNSHFSWLDVHIRSGSFAVANLLEHRLESLLEFTMTIGTSWHRTRIEHRGIVIEREPEMFPI
jgi:hypothetical protein